MSQSEKRTGDAVPPAQMRIRLKYADLATFIERFAPNVNRSGIFIASRAPKPVGTTLRFELLLSDGKTKLLKGEGVVSWVREFDPESPQRPHGMGVRFSRLDADSRQLLERIETVKRERGVKVKEENAVPVPDAPAPEPPPPPPPLAEREPPPRAPRVPLVIDEEIEKLLAADGPALAATLARARAIAHRLVGDGREELERLLRAEAVRPLAPPLEPPPALALPPLPTEMTAPTAVPVPVDAEVSEPTRLSGPPVMPPPPADDDDEERTAERAPMLSSETEDVAAVLDAIEAARAPTAPLPADAAPPPPPQDAKPEKKGFFSKLFKK